MKVLSVVCARAGSKGLRNKCIIGIMNKMVIEYSIEYSLSLGDNVRTVVSTDIGEVIQYCEKNNIEYIRRDPQICTDESKIEEALADAIEKKGGNCDYCSLVYGNIPTRYPKIFYEALEFLENHKDFDCAISMQNVEKFHPEWMFNYNTELLPRQKRSHYRRQSLPQKMIHDGHTLIFKSEKFYNKFKGVISYEKEYACSIYGDKIKPIITTETIIDLDSGRDLELATAIISNSQ